MSVLSYPEWQDWQTTCRVCERVKCPKPEAVGEWLEKLVRQLHEQMLPDLSGHSGWRRQAAFFESLLQCYTVTWSWALRGVCPDCIKYEDPTTAAYLDSPELVDFDAAVRWSCLAPDFKVVSLVRAYTPRGLVRVPAVWRSRGLSVHPNVDFWPTDFRWCISHDRTGYRVTRVDVQDEAVALAELLSEVADWEALDLAVIEADKALHARVKHVVSVLSVGGAR
ncbi:hypothetical protein [Archangium lansingense]|uniref:Uncharacterized protein n=1 Tax=Archangium lansingense TaxID=2995310 RepID=A0ABT4AHE4_9BACT|nr:hypothetical protein [Archangium lansinium]MCY1080319.1 hypothetical protein [Archangium lansinium]